MIPPLKIRPDRNLAFVYHDGRRVYMGAPGEEADARYSAWVLETFGAGKPDGPVTVATLCAQHLAWATDHYASSQEIGHFRALAGELRPVWAAMVDSIGPRKIVELRDGFPATWSAAYRNRQIARFRRVLRWGVEREMCGGAVLATVSAVAPLRAGPRRRHSVPLPLDVARVLAECPATIRAMVWLQILTGARPANVCRIAPSEIDRSSDPWEWRPAKHKKAWRGGDLVVWLGPLARHVLAPFLDRPAVSPCFSPREAEAQRGRRARPSAGDAYTVGTYRNALRRVCQRIGVAVWSPYQLRHMRAELAEASHGAEGVQAILDHDRIDTSRHYLERRRRLAREIAESLG